MPKGADFSSDFLALIFNATPIPNIADNAGSGPLTSLQVALHTDDPMPAGDQTTSEASYTGYGRIGVSRSNLGWTVTGQVVSPVSDIVFGTCTAGSDTITHWSVGTAGTGAGEILYAGAIGTNEGPCTADAASDVLEVPNNDFSVNDAISFIAIPGFALPGGITDGTTYYVLTVSGSAITISDTIGGSTLDITSDGVAEAFRETPISVSVGVTPSITTSATIDET
jgi:hypothetical protein